MEVVSDQGYRCEVVGAVADACGVLAGVQDCAHAQTGRGGGVGDPVDDDVVAFQRSSSPGQGDLGEQPVLDLQLQGKQLAERLTVEEMEKELAVLGGIAGILPKAPAEMKAKLYAPLGVRLEYDHVLKRVRATAESACVPGRVRRGT